MGNSQNMASNVLDNSQENIGGNIGQNGGGSKDEIESRFDCYICLEMAKDPVVSMCGHLFCWPCLHKWLDTHPNCPVCRTAINKDKVIPLYGRGGNGDTDPRDKIPPRPQAHSHGQRTEETFQRPQPQGQWISRRQQAQRTEETFQRPQGQWIFRRPQAQRTEETSRRPQGHRQNIHDMLGTINQYMRRRAITTPRMFISNSSRMQQNQAQSSTMQQAQAQSSNSYRLTPQQQRIFDGLTPQQQRIYDFILRCAKSNRDGVYAELIRSAVQPDNDFKNDLRILKNARKIRTTFDDYHYSIVE